MFRARCGAASCRATLPAGLRASGFGDVRLRDVIPLPMTSVRLRTLLTAWLGLLAMALIVLAPLVSQLERAATRDAALAAAPLCAAQPAGMHGKPQPLHDSLAACGYCNLLAHPTPAPALAAPVATALILLCAAAPVLSIGFRPREAFPAGQPRAPPR
jgi:hypothetical protein